MDLVTIVNHFNIDGDISNITSFGSGHINTTYKVETIGNGFDYLLQSINTDIFNNIDSLSSNITRITSHIQGKLSLVFPTEEIYSRSITVVKTKAGNEFYKDIYDRFWRVFIFIKNSESFEEYKNEEYAYLAGAGFGDYQWMLSDLPKPNLYDVIPNFHNTTLRIENLKKTIEIDPYSRLKGVQAEVDYLLGFSDEMNSIIELGNKGVIPMRIVHQDTKISNILFNEKGEFLCVIDLDTTMLGYVCYDFGDAIRGGMNTAAEDEDNTENVAINMSNFKAFTKGYAATTKSFLSQDEVKTLAFGAKLITFEQSIRFLDDYLNGDKYYRCTKPKHNLIRTRAQIALLKSIIINFNTMEAIVLECFEN